MSDLERSERRARETRFGLGVRQALTDFRQH
jgi:hypothetical protein